MKLKKFVLLIFCSLIGLSGCNNLYASGESEAQQINAAFAEALNAKDKDGIKALLCEYTLEEDDIDEQIEDMFAFFDKSIFPISKSDIWDKGAGAEEEFVANGEKTLKIASNLEIQNKNGKQYLVVCFAYVCCSDPKKIGVSQIKVIDETNLPDDLDERLREKNNENRLCFVGEYID